MCEQGKASPRLVRASILTRCQTLDGVAHDGMLVDAAVVEEGHGYASPAAVLPLEGVAPIRLHRVSGGRSEETRARGASKQGRSSGAGGSGALCDDKPQPPSPSPGSLRGFTHTLSMYSDPSCTFEGSFWWSAPSCANLANGSDTLDGVRAWVAAGVERWRLGQVRNGGWAGSAAPECL